VPVASIDGLRDIKGEFDELVCLETPEPFYSVGMWYQDFKQLDDADVKTMLLQHSSQNLKLAL
jgi:putative phosphoribosyl transferase